jgi:hypothetical protein
MGKHKGDFLLILDIDRVFSEEELLAVSTAEEQETEPVEATTEA